MQPDPIQKFKAALETNPQNHLARFSLAKLFFDQGRFAEAAEGFRRASEAKPDWMAALILLGKCELALNDKVAAKNSFIQARKLAITQNHEGPLAEIEGILTELE